MSDRVSQLNLYDVETLTKKFSIKATGNELQLPAETTIQGVKLEDASQSIFNMNKVLQELTGKLIVTSEQDIKNDSEEAKSISADQGLPIANPTDPGLGWYFTNSSASAPNNKINWYFVGSSDKTLGDLFNISARLKLYNNSSLQSLPYITIYTQGTANGWYESRQNWLVSSGDQSLISANDEVLLYHGTDDPTRDTDVTHYQLEKDNATSVGPQLASEKIFLIALSSDSGAPLNSVQLALTKFISSYKGNTTLINTTS